MKKEAIGNEVAGPTVWVQRTDSAKCRFCLDGIAHNARCKSCGGSGYDIALPVKVTPGSSGFDLRCASQMSITLHPGMRIAIPTGLRLQIPDGFEGQIRPRSGIALTDGATIINSPGTIDSDFRGEIQVLLINLGQNSFVVRRRTRIAQLVICPVVKPVFMESDFLTETERGSQGCGSSGLD